MIFAQHFSAFCTAFGWMDARCLGARGVFGRPSSVAPRARQRRGEGVAPRHAGATRGAQPGHARGDRTAGAGHSGFLWTVGAPVG